MSSADCATNLGHDRTTRGRGEGFARRLAALAGTLQEWAVRRQERRELRGLEESLLKDLAFSGGDVARETGKPFWRP